MKIRSFKLVIERIHKSQRNLSVDHGFALQLVNDDSRPEQFQQNHRQSDEKLFAESLFEPNHRKSFPNQLRTFPRSKTRSSKENDRLRPSATFFLLSSRDFSTIFSTIRTKKSKKSRSEEFLQTRTVRICFLVEIRFAP